MAAHVHTVVQNTPCDGQQGAPEILGLADAQGFTGVATVNHVGNPYGPVKVQSQCALVTHLSLHLARGRQFRAESEFPWFPGLETHVLATGELDGPIGLLAQADWVIATIRGGLWEVADDPGAMTHLLKVMAIHQHVTVLGHPAAYLGPEIDWPEILKLAAVSNTAVEISFTRWLEGPGMRPHRGAYQNWTRWLGQLADSGVAVMIGLGIHAESQWPSDERKLGRLAEFCEQITGAGIGPERCLTSSAGFFGRWVRTPKQERRGLVTW